MHPFAPIVFSAAMLISTAGFTQTADMVFTNASVLTMDDANPIAEAVAVEGNKIIFVGSAADVQQHVGDGTEVFDLDGKMLLPGFVDSHNHLIAADWIGQGLPLYDATTKEETLSMIAEYAAANPDLPVITGAGWSPSIMGGFPTAAELDTVISDRPALFIDVTSHEGWLNSAAMTDQKISKETPDKLPGTTFWVRDDDGNPTGVGVEFQWLDVYIGLGLWDPETMVPASAEKLLGAATKFGTTALLSPGVLSPTLTLYKEQLVDYSAAMEALAKMADAGELPIRSFSMPTFKAKDAKVEGLVEFTLKMKDKYNSDMHGVRGIKIHPESGILTLAAPMVEPYASKDTTGSFGVSPERTMALVLAANAVGLDVAIHVEGTASTRAGIDAFEAAIKAGHTDVRNSLHHYTLVRPEDHQRVIDLDILVNASPFFYNTFSGQDAGLTEALGEERVMTMLGLYTDLAYAGNKVGLGSDYPGTPVSFAAPLLQIQAAMTMKDPTDPNSRPFPPTRPIMRLDQALRAYTIDGAYFVGMEDKIGSLEVGKLADLVVLEQDLRQVPVEQLKDVKVVATIMDGVFRHRDGV